MALTVRTIAELGTQGPVRCLMLNIDLDNSYPTGGYPLSGGVIPFNPMDMVISGVAVPGGPVVAYNSQNKTLQCFDNSAACLEIPNATDLSAFTRISAVAFGI